MIWPFLPKGSFYYFKCCRQAAQRRRYFRSQPLSQTVARQEEEEEDEEDKVDRRTSTCSHHQGNFSLVREIPKRVSDGPSRNHPQVPFLSQIRSLCQQGNLDCALQRLLVRDRLCSTRDVYLCLLRTCILQQALPQAMQIHAHLVNHKADLTGVVGDYVVVALAKCGGVELARQVSASLPRRTVFSWTSMISAYTDAGLAHEALNMYQLMLEDGVEPDHYTFVSLLKACGSLPDLERGKQLHHEAQRMGFASDVFVGNTLVSMYGKCGDVLKAENVFSGLLVHDDVACNAMLSVYVEQGCTSKVLQLYRQMQDRGINGNELTLGITIQACHTLAEEVDAPEYIKKMAFEIGRALHHDARNMGFNSSAFVANMLVSLYGKCGMVPEAEAVFCMLPTRDAQFWTIMLSVYVEQLQGKKALQFYKHMLFNDMHSDSYMLVTALQACSNLSEKNIGPFLDGLSAEEVGLEIGMALHQDARWHGFTPYVYVATALLTMYGKFGRLVEAEDIFHNLSERTIVSWTAMLSAFVEQGEHSKALSLFRCMQEESIPLDDVTIICVLQACSELGNLDICKQIHLAVLAAGGYGKKVGVLVHSYASCASMADAHAVFDEMVQPNVVVWSGCMAGSAEVNSQASLVMLEAMRLSGVNPNHITFSSVLSACSHSGLTSEGIEYFHSMGKDYDINQEMKHYVYLTDLLGRAGNFKKLESILSRMPMQPNLTIWLCLLGMCLRHGNLELGKQAFIHAVKLEPTEAVTYILMSNIYAESAFEVAILGSLEETGS
ncbi:hypothetical protein L7F22_035279 [Adiantum nelumboides]|nr:hypothetical protein [Adiantum nelumboides]